MENRSKTANTIKIEKCISIEEHVNELSTLLIQVVEDGASIGFLPPLDRSEANQYWGSVLNPGVILFLAKMNHEIAGTVQLHLCQKQNGGHRAEIAKLMTHPNYRRNGIGRLLMEKAQETAIKMGRSLLVLDTREGDPSNLLYASLGFIQGGRIPNYARSENGQLDATIIYYKNIM
ncbi:GNAT family N-acetyltransferase [Bacillus salipaludis]|uniref:GNAT family N-acetyltransferase n=1 Tax=Bacillus salipaludis TaxID=2547811 RepID=UPI003D25B35D